MLIFTQNKKKGISPFVAFILLIAFTLAIGVVVYKWLHFVTGQQEGVAAHHSTMNCEYFSFDVNTVYYYPSKRQLVIKVTNTGSYVFRVTEIDVFNSTYYRRVYTYGEYAGGNTPINPGSTVYIILDNVIPNVTEVRVIPAYCQGAAVTLSGWQIKYVD